MGAAYRTLLIGEREIGVFWTLLIGLLGVISKLVLEKLKFLFVWRMSTTTEEEKEGAKGAEGTFANL
jgi:hypothetical protein